MNNDANEELIGKTMKLVAAHSPNIVDVVEVLAIKYGLIQFRFPERSRCPVIWMPISSIVELRETET